MSGAEGNLAYINISFMGWQRIGENVGLFGRISDLFTVDEILDLMTQSLAPFSGMTRCLVKDAEGVWVVGWWGILWRWSWLERLDLSLLDELLEDNREW